MKQCMLCNSAENSKKIGRNKPFGMDIMYCSKCKLGYFLGDDSAVKKKLSEFYRKEYWHPSSGERESSTFVDKLRRLVISLGVPPLICVSHNNIIKKIIKKYGVDRETDKDRKLIDIGCGQGDALRFFKSKGWTVSGVESDKLKVSEINSRLGKGVCMAGDAEQYALQGTYDVIYLCHVLEHLTSPLESLRKTRRHLGKKGIIFIEVPNCENEKMLKTSIGTESHTHHFSLHSIRKLFRKAGYSIILSDVYDDRSPNQLFSFFLSLLRIPSYRRAGLKTGRKIILIARS